MNIALLARVSTQEQAVNGHSIGEQLERMRDYCKAMEWSVYKEYVDAGYSGSNTDRPALQRMIKDVKAGKIDKVLVYKLDRLSRSQKDTLELIEDVFLANNTDFVSISESFDTSTPFGRAMIGILAVFAQLEREQIKERMMMGQDARAKSGKFHATRYIPIGYDYINGNLVVNQYEAMQIKRIFQEYAKGKAPYTISDELNNAGLHHKHGKWKHDTIRDILQKKTYVGYIKHRGNWLKGIHEAIIDDDLFCRVQDEMQRRSEEHHKHNRRAGKASSYLGGYLICKHCGAKYSKFKNTIHQNGKTYVYCYYKCNSRTKKQECLIKDKNCKNKHWKMDDLDNIVFDEIRKLAVDSVSYERAIKKAEPDHRPEIIRNEIEKLDDKLARYMDLYAIGNIPVNILQDRIHDLDDQKSKLEAELERITNENADKLSLAETMELAESFDNILEYGNYDEIRAVIGSLINKIEIDNEDIIIHWNFI